jgi:hypothetical protein
MSPRSVVGRLVGVTYGKSRLDGLECCEGFEVSGVAVADTYGKSRLDGLECCEGFEVSGVAVADQGARFGSTVPEDFG